MKKGYKQLQRRLLNETYKRLEQQMLKLQYKEVADAAQEEAEKYKERFRKFGSNVETVDTGGGVECLKWEVEPQQWGSYVATLGKLSDESVKEAHRTAVEKIVQGLMERNVIQFVDKTENAYGPFVSCIYAAKLYVVPWEQMPHKRTMELYQEVEKSIDIPPLQP